MSVVTDEIYCLLLPLADERLLVPRSCVTEVVNYQAPTPMEAAAPFSMKALPRPTPERSR